jgi:hypothetical protein
MLHASLKNFYSLAHGFTCVIFRLANVDIEYIIIGVLRDNYIIRVIQYFRLYGINFPLFNSHLGQLFKALLLSNSFGCWDGRCFHRMLRLYERHAP